MAVFLYPGLMEKAVELHQGKLLSSTEGTHWLVHTANRYHFTCSREYNTILDDSVLTLHTLTGFALRGEFFQPSSYFSFIQHFPAQ